MFWKVYSLNPRLQNSRVHRWYWMEKKQITKVWQEVIWIKMVENNQGKKVNQSLNQLACLGSDIFFPER